MPAPEPRRIDYPDQETFPGVYVILPAAWLGEHFERAAMASVATAKIRSRTVANACIALVLTDEFHLPGLAGADPAAWNLAETPAELLVWLERVVYNDFNKVYAIPKASPSPSQPGLTGTEKTNTAGT